MDKEKGKDAIHPEIEILKKAIFRIQTKLRDYETRYGPSIETPFMVKLMTWSFWNGKENLRR